MPDLFDPLRMGDLILPNRIVMSPLTRCRGNPDGLTATPLMAEYYSQRAGAGLIISEGIPVSPMGVGYAGLAGLWNERQVEHWRLVTDAVHRAGGRIVAQLWHVGRLSDPVFLDGAVPMAPSALAANGTVTMIRPKRPWEVPRALEQDEIAAVVEQFRHAASNALQAGFDGIDIHAANGYLIDQFLQAGSNRREDAYGGPIENRVRLLLEIVDAVTPVFGRGRTGVHLSPRDGHSMFDPNPVALFSQVAEALDRRGLAFIYAREALKDDSIGPILRGIFGGAYIANEKVTAGQAADIVATGQADAVGFGKLFIANPDLPRRLRHGLPLAEPDPATFYSGGRDGYTDYPASVIMETL